MYFNELNEKSKEYQSGHQTGSIRAIDHCVLAFQLSKKKKWKTEEIIRFLENEKSEWLEHCETFGMGVDEE